MAMVKNILGIGVGLLGLLSTATAADAFTIKTNTLTDTEFNTLLNSSQFTELFVAESRAGNGRTNGDYEISINKPIPAGGTFPGTFVQAQKQWVSGQAVNFELNYDALTGEIKYTVGDTTLTTNNKGSSAPNGIFLRTRAGGQTNTQSSSLLLTNLMLDDGNGFQGLDDVFSSFTAGSSADTDYLVLADVMGSFTLKGTEVLSWEGQYPNASRLASQIKVGFGPYTETESVPEPALILGSLVVGAGALTMKRKSAQS